jgi:GTP pyrophosphokinase
MAETQSPTSAPARATPAPDPARARALIFPLYGERGLRTGETFTAHADGMVEIVGAVRADPDLLAASYLFGAHDVLRDADDWIRTHFGASVAQLVADLRQLMLLSDSVRARMRSAAEAQSREQGRAPGRDEAAGSQDAALRRMLLAMVNDLRVVVLRLASRQQTLRYFSAGRGEGVEAYALETAALYTPLANRLGIWQIKWELEDLSLRFLQPEKYQRIAGLLERERGEREREVEAAVEGMQRLLRGAGIAAEVSGRPKHIASIEQKMRAKGVEFEQVYDMRALRVIVERVEQCYEVLALVHQRWRPIDSEFDDYIVKPKPNGYQSLHTVVDVDDGWPLEIQIRTRRMHESAELGVAAHWRYKERGRDGGRQDDRDTERIAWLRRLLDWRHDVEPARRSAQEDRVYALTPQGRVVELPAGATAIDFAYHIHTELGHRCRGARIDGALVALNTPLRTGQTVEVITARTGGPSRDWLNPELGFLAGPRSKAKVRQWFNAVEFEQSVAAGREIVDRELQRLGRTAVRLEDLARRLGFDSVEALCAAATKDEFSLRSLEQALASEPVPAPEPAPLADRPKAAPAGRGKVLVVGVDSLLTSLARCCRPIPPDDIIGFVTRGRGVSVHRANCVNAAQLAARQSERVIEVAWGSGGQAYPVEVLVLAMDRQGLLRDVSEVFSREKLNVIGVNTVSQRDQARMQFTVEVPDAASLRRTLAQLAEIKGVLVARRR